MLPKKDPTKKLLRKQERETRRKQQKFERQSRQSMRDRMRNRYQNGGRPGGFLSSTARGGFPDVPKSYYPYTGRSVASRGDERTEYSGQGYQSALRELLQVYRTPGLRGERKVIGIPTGRQYLDTAQHGFEDTYRNNGLIERREGTYREKRDDIEKMFDLYQSSSRTTPKGGESKSVEISGKDLNWFQRNFPRLLMERYKVKSKYGPEGELLRRVTTSRAGGREMKEYPTQAELDAMIAEDIRRVQNGE